jgi:hypothetical protein
MESLDIQKTKHCNKVDNAHESAAAQQGRHLPNVARTGITPPRQMWAWANRGSTFDWMDRHSPFDAQ